MNNVERIVKTSFPHSVFHLCSDIAFTLPPTQHANNTSLGIYKVNLTSSRTNAAFLHSLAIRNKFLKYTSTNAPDPTIKRYVS